MRPIISADSLLRRVLVKGRLRQFQIVIAVANTGSMHRAADELSMSQPAVSKAVSEIESDLGVQLFERHARGARLTHIGKETLPLLRRVLDATELLTDAVTAHRNTQSSIIRVGAVAAGISGLLALRAPAFCRLNADVQLRVAEIDGRSISDLAVQGDYDIFICRTPDTIPEGWSFHPLIEDEHAIFAAPNHRLVGKANVELDELAAETWLMPPAGVPTLQVLEALFAGRPMPKMHQLATRALILSRSAIVGFGVLTIAPVSIYRTDLEYALLCRINFDLASKLAPLGVLCPQSHMGTVLKRFIDFLSTEPDS